jgi:branched-chain amino acid transport system substrate-binding protein
MKRVLLAGSTAFFLTCSVGLSGSAVAANPQAAMMTKVTICTSTPYGVASLKQLSQGIRNGVHLSIENWAMELKAAHLEVSQVDYDYASTTDPSNYDPNRAGANARDCLSHSNSLGLIGTLNSGAAEVSEPITNKAHLAMISPANTSPTLTDPASRTAEEPCSTKTAKCSDRIPFTTYFRTVTTDELQGPTGALYAHKTLHATSYVLVNDGLTYGVGLATFFHHRANTYGMKDLGNSQIDTTNTATSSSTIAQQIEAKDPNVVYCGCDSETSNLLAYDLRTGGYMKPFVAGDAIVDNSDWLNSTTAASPGAGIGATNTGGTTVGPAHAAAFFTALYKKDEKSFYNKYGIQPYDATSYDATTALLKGIINAEKAGDLHGSAIKQRTAVTKFVHQVNFVGATGRTKFDKNGDTTNKILSIYHVVSKGGKLAWAFLYQVKATGNPV